MQAGMVACAAPIPRLVGSSADSDRHHIRPFTSGIDRTGRFATSSNPGYLEPPKPVLQHVVFAVTTSAVITGLVMMVPVGKFISHKVVTPAHSGFKIARAGGIEREPFLPTGVADFGPIAPKTCRRDAC